MHPTRRGFLKGGALLVSVGRASAGVAVPPPRTRRQGRVVTPNGVTDPGRMVKGARIFHLIVQTVTHEFAPGLSAECFGYNGRVHGPTLEATEGERVRIYVTNRLDTNTTVHWHGLYVPNGMDGVGGLSQRPIEPGETFLYEFELRQHGTYMYHSHHDEMTQMALGLMGMFVVHPRGGEGDGPARDYAYLLSTWALKPGLARPDPNEMSDFNVLTLNAKIFPATEAMVAKRGERVRIRIGNLSAMDHHPIHLHGHSFAVTATDGGAIPPSAQWREVSVLVPVGSTRTIEFIADNPGDWAFHCHMTHHVMTQMGHGIPNLVGVEAGDFDAALGRVIPGFGAMGGSDEEQLHEIPPNSLPMMGGAGPFGYITMSGMFSILKVRDHLETDSDPGWYENPPGTVAEVASPEQLAADGIELPG